MKQNENYTDRLVRLLLAIIIAVIWCHWVWWITQTILLIIAWIIFLTSVTWFCPLYLAIKLDTTKYKNFSKKVNILLFLLILITWWILVYTSIFFTTKFFIKDYNEVNNSYKQLLFNTWKEKREESIKYYEELVPKLEIFKNKYWDYKPFKIKFDTNFNSDIQKIDSIIKELKDWVYTWNLAETHIKLEWVRTILQDILKRNWFSLSWIALVDFHDIMEVLIEASDKKDKEMLIKNYDLASEKLQIVESYKIDWTEIIRKNLDTLLDLAKNDKLEELSKQAGELKSSFIKVYLSNN